MEKIRIGIVGYGNIGRGVEQAIARNDDMELKAVFTRRDPKTVSIKTEGAEVKHFDDMVSMLWDRKLLRTSVLLTVLTHTQRFRSILQMWMLQQKQETM